MAFAAGCAWPNTRCGRYGFSRAAISSLVSFKSTAAIRSLRCCGLVAPMIGAVTPGAGAAGSGWAGPGCAGAGATAMSASGRGDGVLGGALAAGATTDKLAYGSALQLARHPQLRDALVELEVAILP